MIWNIALGRSFKIYDKTICALGYKTFFQTQLSLKFLFLIKTKMVKNKIFLALKSLVVVFIVGILTFMSMINFMLS